MLCCFFELDIHVYWVTDSAEDFFGLSSSFECYWSYFALVQQHCLMPVGGIMSHY